MAAPGYVDFSPARRGDVDTGAEARALAVTGLGLGVGGTVRVDPHVRDAWSVPVEAGLYPSPLADGVILGTARVGVRHRLRPWMRLGGGVGASYVHRLGGHGVGPLGDVEVAFGRAWEHVGLSAAFRPGVSYNTLAHTTTWMPGEVAVAYRPTSRVSLFGSVHYGFGAAITAFGGFFVSGGGGSIGLQIRLGRREEP